MLAPMYCTQNATRYRAYGLGLDCDAVNEFVDVDVAIVVVGNRRSRKVSKRGKCLAKKRRRMTGVDAVRWAECSAAYNRTTMLAYRTLSYRQRTCHPPAAIASMNHVVQARRTIDQSY